MEASPFFAAIAAVVCLGTSYGQRLRRVRLCHDLADATRVVALELMADRMAIAARPALVAVGGATSRVERTADLNTDVILAQIRSIVADLLLLTGVDELEATDLLPLQPERMP